jgi:hypothetical protein
MLLAAGRKEKKGEIKMKNQKIPSGIVDIADVVRVGERKVRKGRSLYPEVDFLVSINLILKTDTRLV